MAELIPNNDARGALDVGIDDNDLSLTLEAGQGAAFNDPAGVDQVRVLLTDEAESVSEIVVCSNRAGDVLTLSERGAEGTAAAAWSAGDKVAEVLTEAGLAAYVAENAGGGGGAAWKPAHYVGTWAIGTTYTFGDAVRADDAGVWKLYISLKNNNLGNNPVGGAASWDDVAVLGRAIVVEGVASPHTIGEQNRITSYNLGAPTGGTFALGDALGIAWDAVAATIQTALDTAYGIARTVVVGNAPTFTVERYGDAIVLDGALLTGGGATSQNDTQALVVGGFAASHGAVYIEASTERLSVVWSYNAADELWTAKSEALVATGRDTNDLEAGLVLQRVGAGDAGVTYVDTARRGGAGSGDANFVQTATVTGDVQGNSAIQFNSTIEGDAVGGAVIDLTASHWQGGLAAIELESGTTTGTGAITLEAGGVPISVWGGTADPSAGGGVAKTAPALYVRDNAGVTEVWVKTDAADTDWTKLL